MIVYPPLLLLILKKQGTESNSQLIGCQSQLIFVLTENQLFLVATYPQDIKIIANLQIFLDRKQFTYLFHDYFNQS